MGRKRKQPNGHEALCNCISCLAKKHDKPPRRIRPRAGAIVSGLDDTDILHWGRFNGEIDHEGIWHEVVVKQKIMHGNLITCERKLRDITVHVQGGLINELENN